MRALFLILNLIPLLLWAQNKPFPSDNNGQIVFAETVSTRLTRTQNYALAKAWIEETFPGTQLQEAPEMGRITAKGSLERFPVTFQDALESIHEKANFTIIMECKDRSLRYQIRDISLICVTTKEGAARETGITHGEHYMNIQYYCNLLTDEEKKLQEMKGTLKGKRLKEEIERYNQLKERYNRIIHYEEEIDDAEYQYFMDLIDSLKGLIMAANDVHVPLPLDDSLSLETLNRGEKSSKNLRLTDEIILNVPTTTGKRPMGSPDDPDYAIFGTVDHTLAMHDANLEEYDRITLQVFPEYVGTGVVNLNLQVNNATPAPVGAHLINLKANTWNDICYELGKLPREKVSSLRFYTDIKGKHATGGDSVRYTIKNVQLERTGKRAKETGWEPEENLICYSTSGYLPDFSKQAFLHASHIGQPFCIREVQSGKVCKEGTVSALKNSLGTFGNIDFTEISATGMYQIEVGEIHSEPFPVSTLCFENSAWRVLNFIFGQRCGYEVKGIHEVCHTDLFADYQGKSVSYGGGWHDAGDLSQQTLQTGDVSFGLLEAAQRFRQSDPKQAERLTEEALWGLKFILQCRLGDGYHASSLGLLHWTDNIVGTFDDIHTVRKQNHAFDNFLYAAYEAYACRVLGERHPLYAELKKAAEEDFAFAAQQYREQGILPYAHIMEHTYNTPPSVFTATASWAATQLYLLTQESDYAEQATAYMRSTLACQETKGSRPELKGFFYRDESRKSIVHFIHQSREQLLAVALVDLCKALPEHTDFPRWNQAISLYADYLKSLMPYTAPYYMAASGTYAKDEYLDQKGFASLHIFAPENAVERYTQQLTTGGIPLDDSHYLKRFPVWFNIYNGNEAIILSIGKAAAKIGSYLHDIQLQEYGLAQLYWTVGRNPFCLSLIYGEGNRYPSMDSFSSGELVGEIPVGIRSWEDSDEPYWPRTNNACYKEVWTTSAGKWLSLISEY